ncbi:cytochrome P450 82G1 [Carica papaya]|uniref:cytochrome P450 82G1 n=1 Tax=Carica papaya TaxID=3649 RepID=UPI000B8CEC7D|nr:cytochrome P450 82G1 [Carica papaya]
MDFPSDYIHSISVFLTLLMIYALSKTFLFKQSNKSSAARKIPEPSRPWPLIGHLHLLGRHDPICRQMGSMADMLGPIFWLKLGRHRLLVVSSPELVKNCFTTNDKILATRPSIAAGRYMGYNNAILALAPQGKYWRDIRKLVTVELLSTDRLELLKHIRFLEVDTFIKELYKQSAAVDLSKSFEGLTFNMILRMVMGKRYSSDDYGEGNSEVSRYKSAIKKAEYLSGVFVEADAIPWLEWLDIQGHVRSMKETAKELDSVISGWLDEHLQKRRQATAELQDSDFMDAMLSTLPEDAVISGYTRHIIVKATALILTLTGSESISITLTWALSLLINNPTVVKVAQDELDREIGKEKWVEESDMNKLNYLQAIVKETLRLYPPGPITGLREAMEDCDIGGYLVPKGTRVIVNIWKLQRDPRVWKNPCEFRPERFMADNNGDHQNKFEFIPFSSGRRGCPGATYGLQVVQLTVARLLQGFHVRAAVGSSVDMREGLGISMPKVNPLHVCLTPRLHHRLYH